MALRISNPIPSSPVILPFISYSGDFNADGKQDILWRNTQTGEVRIWYMNGSSILSDDIVATVGPNYKIVPQRDFAGPVSATWWRRMRMTEALPSGQCEETVQSRIDIPRPAINGR